MAEGSHPNLPLYDLRHMAKTPPPPVDWVVDEVAARGEVTLIWGKPGKGKSLLCQAMCGGVARGEPVAGLDCKKGRALYLDAENGEFEVHRRVQALNLHPTRVAIADASRQVSLLVADDEDEVVALAEEHRADLIVLDSLRKLTVGSEENDSSDMVQALGVAQNLAKRLNAAVIVVHHARKDGGDYRGSSAIEGEASIVLKFAEQEGETDKRRRFLDCQKCRVAREPAKRWLRLQDDGAGNVSIEEADEGVVDGIVAHTKRASRKSQILDRLGEQPARIATLGRELEDDPKSRGIRRALDELAADGYVQKREDGLWEVAGGTVAAPDQSTSATSRDDGSGTATRATATSATKGGGNRSRPASATAPPATPEPTRSRAARRPSKRPGRRADR